MSYNDFNEDMPEDPTNIASGEYTVSARPETITALKDAIFEAVGVPMPGAAWKTRPLFVDDNPNQKVFATRFNPDSRRSLDKIASISIQESGDGTVGNTLSTNCAILNAPDGLQLEQHTTLRQPLRIKDDTESDSSEAFGSAAKVFTLDVAELRARKSAQALEDELGLSIVPEETAQYFLSLIRSAHP